MTRMTGPDWAVMCKLINMHTSLRINASGIEWSSHIIYIAEKGKKIFPRHPRSRLRVWPRETDSAVPSRASLLISILRLNMVLTHGIPPDFSGGVNP